MFKVRENEEKDRQTDRQTENMTGRDKDLPLSSHKKVRVRINEG
jgi:hypothetical protein